MHASLAEALRNGFNGGGLSWQALVLAKLIKLGCLAIFLLLVRRELGRFFS
jgi:hypothetical protein